MGEKVSGTSLAIFGVLVDLAQNIGVLVLYIWNCVHFHYMFRWWVIKREPGFAVVSILFGLYLLIAFVGTIYLLCATVPNSSLERRKSICKKWLIFRLLSLLIPIAFLFYFNDSTLVGICSVVIFLWFITILIVASYYFSISETLDSRKQNKSTTTTGEPGKRSDSFVQIHRHRPSRQVGPLAPQTSNTKNNLVPGSLTSEHLKQLEDFQDYVRRTSWCNYNNGFDSSGSQSSRNASAVQSRF